MNANTATVEGTTRGTLLVVDGHSLAFRAFFALPVENFSTSAGQATNAVWGFATMLSQVIDAEHPDHLAPSLSTSKAARSAIRCCRSIKAREMQLRKICSRSCL